MFDATAPGFDGPAGCPTQSRIRFRRLWLRFSLFSSREKEEPKTRVAVPRLETCLSRLNVVNTEFQLRHLIFWSSIVIHVSSESATRAGGRRDEKESVVTDAGGGAYLALTASPTGNFVADRHRENRRWHRFPVAPARDAG